MDTLTKAVNGCLRGIGLRPVASYNDPNLNAATALASIADASKQIQQRGWWFNEEKGWKLFPDSNGQIKAPNNILDITSWNGSVDKSLTVRGGYVYNTLTHSNILTDSVNSEGCIEFIFITELPFEDLPPVAQTAIALRAKRLFAQDIEGDVNKWKFNVEDEKRAYAELESAQTRNAKQNALQNPAVAAFIGSVGGQNARRYSGLFPEKRRQQ